MSDLVSFEPVRIGDVKALCLHAGGDDVWVNIDPLCGELRLSANDQWAILFDPVYHGQFICETRITKNGRSIYGRFIHYRSIPVWLNKLDLRQFTRDPAKLRALQTVQRECTAAIEERFFSRNGSPNQPLPNANHLVPDNTGLSPLSQLARGMALLAENLDQQHHQISSMQGQLTEVREIACDALDVQTLRGRGQFFTVLACFKLWRLPSPKADVNNAGREIAATAKREGWYNERHDAYDAEYGTINNWPARRILWWFTDRHGDCPKAEIRQLLQTFQRC